MSGFGGCLVGAWLRHCFTTFTSITFSVQKSTEHKIRVALHKGQWWHSAWVWQGCSGDALSCSQPSLCCVADTRMGSRPSCSLPESRQRQMRLKPNQVLLFILGNLVMHIGRGVRGPRTVRRPAGCALRRARTGWRSGSARRGLPWPPEPRPGCRSEGCTLEPRTPRGSPGVPARKKHPSGPAQQGVLNPKAGGSIRTPCAQEHVREGQQEGEIAGCRYCK